MTMEHQRRWTTVPPWGLLLLVVTSGCAQQPATPPWPSKNISIIVPFRPGGGFDLQARMLAPFLEKYLPNQVQVLIQNIEGASGNMGAVRLARSAPDGYTIGVVGVESVAFMRALGQLEEDPAEWTWLGQLSSDALLVAANSAAGIRSPADLLGKDVRFGVTSEMFPSAAVLSKTLGARFRLIHFDGSGDVILAGMRGDVDAVVSSWPTAIKGVRESQGKMVPVFVVNKARLPALSDVPTMAELGVQAEPGIYAVGSVSRALVAPSGLAAQVREALVSAIAKATSDPEFVSQMKRGEFEVVPASPDEVRAKVRAAVDQFFAAKDLVASYVR